ncbi:hypothetical protein JXM83_03740 [Candidatus Woesearchaeota archaeon]|nr:hypothetical protein [Candidatus Woesearchaeota archaeon]
MEDLKKVYNELIDSTIFKAWKDSTSNAYLTHAFTMYEKESESEWQFGYYNKDTDKITTFVIGDDIKRLPEADVLKREGLLNELKFESVQIDAITALKAAKSLQEEKYKGQEPLKIIVLLQNLEEGIVWNLTYLTIGFKTLNIKISAVDASVVDHSLKSIIGPQ